MILIAPDKYKGTLTAQQAASAIASAFGHDCIVMPMADGGEGTAAAIGNGEGWTQQDGYYENTAEGVAAIDSSAYIGKRQPSLFDASSAPLGEKVKEVLGRCDKVMIGVGGTATCDAGVGFLQALGLDILHDYADKIIGLCDVAVPLLPSDSPEPPATVAEMLAKPSALTFAAQKGAIESDYPTLWRRLYAAKQRYGIPGIANPYEGAGGGMGFAIGTAIGAKCVSGAEFVWNLVSKNLDWSKVDLVITGEGCIDDQTPCGKVVDIVSKAAAAHCKPCVAIGGTVKGNSDLGCRIIASDRFMPELPLTPETAAIRLEMAASSLTHSL